MFSFSPRLERSSSQPSLLSRPGGPCLSTLTSSSHGGRLRGESFLFEQRERESDFDANFLSGPQRAESLPFFAPCRQGTRARFLSKEPCIRSDCHLGSSVAPVGDVRDAWGRLEGHESVVGGGGKKERWKLFGAPAYFFFWCCIEKLATAFESVADAFQCAFRASRPRNGLAVTSVTGRREKRRGL